MRVELLVLGPLELRAGETPVPIRRGRPRRLLLSLLLRAGDALPAEVLIDRLWGESPPQNAPNALQILVSYLRKRLAEAPDVGTIETAAGGYRLLVREGAVDLHRFEAAVAAAPALPPEGRVQVLDGALQLWRGNPLAELTYDDFAQGDIVRLSELRVRALEARIDALLELGRHREVVGDLQQLVVEHPLRERFHAQLMLALYRSDRQADALRAFEVARSSLLEELGLDPGVELRTLERGILEQDPALGAPAAVPPPAPTSPTGSPGTARAPHPSSDTVGRAADIQKVRAHLASRRAVTLTGPGGAGKTRLASEVTVTEDLVWWAELSPAGDAAGVLRVLSDATGAPLPSEHDGGDALVGHLSQRTGILVLDTCEHVVEPLRPLVNRLLDHTEVTILATSRQPLRVRDELAWQVPPLALPDPGDLTLEAVVRSDAVELFRRRASSVNGAFEIDDRNAADVAQICLLLDGLPLALELAAAHVGVLTPSSIVRLLDDRLRLLVSPDGWGRQQTLRATIDWSYERLTDDEATFLNRLSVFAGPFPLEAAVVVGGDGLGGDGLEILLTLANQSLVAATADDRFRLLDTIQAYTAERLTGTEAHGARSRHASWYRALAGEADPHLRGGDAAGWMAELRAELPNFRAALEWSFGGGDPATGAALAAALSWFWAVEGLFGEAGRWLDAALGVVEGGSAVEATLLSGRGMHASSVGDLASAVRDCTRAVALFEDLGLDRGSADALIYVGVAQWGLGHLDEAAEAHDRSLAIFRELRDDWGFAISMMLRARTAVDRAEPDVSERLDVALPVARRVGDAHIVAMCLEQRSRTALGDGDAALAETLARESLELHEMVGYAEGTVASLHALGLALLAQGRVEEADVLHRRGLRLACELDHPGGLADGVECLALVAAARSAAGDAVQLLSAADALRERRTVARPASRTRLLAAPRAAVEAALDPDELRHRMNAGRVLDLTALANG